MLKLFSLPHKHKWLSLFILVILLIFIGNGVRKIQINLDMGDAASQKSNTTKRHLPMYCFIHLTSKYHTVLNKKYLSSLKKISAELKKITGVTQVNNILTAKSLFNTNGAISTSNIINTIPSTVKESDLIKKRFSDNKIIKRDLITSNYKASTITLELAAVANKKAIVISSEIEKTLKKYDRAFAKIVYVGIPRISSHANSTGISQTPKLVGLAVLLMILVVCLVTRSYTATLITTLLMIINVILSLGLMGYLHIEINVLSIALPLIIVVIGSTESLHLLCGYNKERSKSTNNSEKAVAGMITHVYKSAIMTSITTIIGFFSFSFTSSSPVIHDFGLSGGLAMLVCGLTTLFLTPMLLAFFPGKNKTAPMKNKRSASRVFSTMLGKIVCQHSTITIASFGAIIIICFWAASHLRADTSLFETLKPHHPVSKDIRSFRNDLGGVATLILQIKGRSVDSVVQEKNLNNMMNFGNALLAQKNISNVYSFADVVAKLNEQINGGDKQYYNIPKSNEKIQQLLTLIDLDNYSSLANHDLDTLYIKLRFRMDSMNQTLALEKKIQYIFNSLPNNTLKLTIQARQHNTFKGIKAITKEGIFSLLSCITLIFILFCIQFNSITSGLISIATNITPLVILACFMVALHINIDVPSIVSIIIALSICVDDTIHFFTKFSHFSQHTKSANEAIINTLDYELLPIMTSTFSTILGMTILTFSHLIASYYLGLVIAAGVFFAMLCDMLLTPALLSKFRIITLADMLSFQYDTRILSTSPAFKGMTKNEIKKITLLCNVKTINKGEQLIKKGVEGDSMFLLLDGQVEVKTDKKPSVLLSTGDVIGEMSYFSNTKRTANCYAKQDSTLLVFNEKCMKHSMKMHKKLFYNFNRNIVSIIIERLSVAQV